MVFLIKCTKTKKTNQFQTCPVSDGTVLAKRGCTILFESWMPVDAYEIMDTLNAWSSLDAVIETLLYEAPTRPVIFQVPVKYVF